MRISDWSSDVCSSDLLISGPTQMGFADMAAYALVLAHIGPVAMAVTSALNYQFLRPCRPGPLFADASMLRLGKRLAVMDVRIWTDDADRDRTSACRERVCQYV